MVLNQSVEEWCMSPENLKHGLYMVAIKNIRVPISNQICPICNKGWNAPFKFAVKNNIVYHLKCLKKMNMLDKNVIHE